MDDQSIFAWVDFYQEFADKLLQYKNNRQELIAKVKQMFEITGINIPIRRRCSTTCTRSIPAICIRSSPM